MPNISAAAVDHRVKIWNRLLSTSAPFQLESIRIIESDIFAPQTITIPRTLALIGLHGTGKTLLLRLLEAAFGYLNRGGQAPPFFRENDLNAKFQLHEPAPIEGTIEVTLKAPQGPVSHIVDLALSAPRRAEIWKKDLGGSYSIFYLGPLQAFGDFEYLFQEYNVTLAESTSSRKLTADELHSRRNILGRSYESMSIHTLRVDSDEYPLPYFSGISRSREIDSSSMSNGELWVHYVDWWFDNTPEGSLMLIDEPETFLAARGRRPFIDLIAARTLQENLQLIIGTHSPEMLARFPLRNIRMCVAGDNGIQITEPASFVQIQDVIGMNVTIRELVLVEDDLAKQILSEIFAQYDVALTRETEIICAGGASEVINGTLALRHMNRLGIVGVLDANERGKAAPKIQAKIKIIEESLFFLPGINSPEEELISAARSEAAWIAKTMGRTVNDVIVALDSCQSFDHQYQIGYLASQLGRSESAVIFMFTQAWLRNPGIRRQAITLTKHVRERISGSFLCDSNRKPCPTPKIWRSHLMQI